MTFKRFAKSFKSMWGACAVVSAAGPLTLWVPELYPPWPDGSSAIATLACMIAFFIAYTLVREILSMKIGKDSAKHMILSVLGISALIAGIALVWGYMSAYNDSVVVIEKQTDGAVTTLRFVIGTELKPGVNPLGKESRDLLLDNMLLADRVWTAESIKAARWQLFSLFSSAFFLMTLGTATLAPLKDKEVFS